MNPYFGDIHNHCRISYGHGSLTAALNNGRRQLDFCSVTGHSSWADMPDEQRLGPVRNYHLEGFDKLESNWRAYLSVIDRYNKPGSFVTFPSYEWHSCDHGDHVFYFRKTEDAAPMIKPRTMEEARRAILSNRERGIDCFIVPHHIGYKTGYRGLNWDTFDSDLCPLVEIVSMHGGADSDDCPVPYYHTMGPRNFNNTVQYGLKRGHRFGVTGSTDHHSAHPGSYGYGLTGVWAKDLTRDSVWNSLTGRRTWAVSGDKIVLDSSLNGYLMGQRCPDTRAGLFTYSVSGEYGLDRIEVVSDKGVLAQKNFLSRPKEMKGEFTGKVILEVGWGEKGLCQSWDGEIEILDGELLESNGHFHGLDVVDPLDGSQEEYDFSRLYPQKDNSIRFSTKTWGCPTSVTNANQALALTIKGTSGTIIRAKLNGRTFALPLAELREGAQTDYLGGFLTGAVRFSRLIREEEYTDRGEFDLDLTQVRSCYLRVSQKNSQYAWGSPITVG